MACIAIDARFIFPMAIHTERHVVQSNKGFHFCHRRNVAMAFCTIYPLCNVRGVVEKNKIGNTIDLHPSDWLAGFPCLPDLDHLRSCCGHELVTSHARLDRGNIRVDSPARSAVTILAVDLIRSCMDGVTERDRLAGTCLLPLTAGGHEHCQNSKRNQPVCRANRDPHFCVSYLSLNPASSAELQGARTPCCDRRAATSSGFAGDPALPHADRM